MTGTNITSMSTGAIYEKYAHNVCQAVVAAWNTAKREIFNTAMGLKEIRDKKLYETEYGSWYAYLEEFQGMGGSQAKKLIEMYEFCQAKNITAEQVEKAGGYTVIYDYSKVKPNVTPDEAKNDIDTLAIAKYAASDLKAAIYDPNCEHEEDYYVIKVCRHCTKRTKLEDTRLK